MKSDTGVRKTLYTQASNTILNAKLWEFSSNIYKIWASHLSNKFKKIA